jgi:hypothetical protein
MIYAVNDKMELGVGFSIMKYSWAG